MLSLVEVLTLKKNIGQSLPETVKKPVFDGVTAFACCP